MMKCLSHRTSGWCGRVPAARAAQPFTFGHMKHAHLIFFGLLLLLSSCKPTHKAVPHPLISQRTVDLGKFEVTGSTLVVIDPGYKLSPNWSMYAESWVKRCATGTWNSELVLKTYSSNGPSGKSGEINAELHGYSQEISDKVIVKWSTGPVAIIGVDSGQAGIFDLKHYHDLSIVPKIDQWKFKHWSSIGGWKHGPADPDNLWYSMCAEATSSENGAGVVPYGTVSTSGQGDGTYEYYVARNNVGETVAIKILFQKDVLP